MREKQPELAKHAPHNALSHCYVSHYLCLHGSIDALLLQSAHIHCDCSHIRFIVSGLWNHLRF